MSLMPSLDDERTCINCCTGVNKSCISSVNPSVGVVAVSCIKLPSSTIIVQCGCCASHCLSACHLSELAASGWAAELSDPVFTQFGSHPHLGKAAIVAGFFGALVHALNPMTIVMVASIFACVRYVLILDLSGRCQSSISDTALPGSGTIAAGRVQKCMLSQAIFSVARVLLLLLLTAGTLARGQVLLGGEVLERWRPAAAEQTLEVDYGPWGELLVTYIDGNHPSGISLFDYNALTAADRQRLDAFIDYLAALPLAQLTPLQQKAYWINLYNSLTVRIILDNPGVASVREIKSGWFRPGPWGLDLIEVDGVALTLDDIEHRILRPIFGDPRIHFAVNCASLGCPNLAEKPYLASKLDQQLDTAASEFINHPRGASIRGDTLTLSSIFKWYGGDFGEGVPARLNWVSSYADPSLAEQLDKWSGRIRYDYDWGLNASP